MKIELRGNLAAMLSAATNAKRSPETGDLSLQVSMVAGARNRRTGRFNVSRREVHERGTIREDKVSHGPIVAIL